MITQKEANSEAVKQTLRLYIGIMLKNWRYTFPVWLLAGFGSTLIFYIPPLIIGQLINGGDVTIQNSWHLLLLFGFVWMAGEICWRIALYLMIRFESNTIQELYTKALNTLINKELSFYANRFTGTITKNILAYARRFETFFDTITFEVISQLIPVLFAAVILAFISPWLSIVLFSMILIGGLVVTPLVKKRMVLVKAREDAHAKMSGHVSDVVSNMAAVKAFGAEKAERRTHDRYVNDFITKARRSWNYQNFPIDSIISPFYVGANVIGLAVVLMLGVDANAKASLFIAFSYFAATTRFMWSFNHVYRRLEEAITDASLFVEYTMEAPKVVDAEDAKVLNVQEGAISFSNVVFTHNENTEALFHDFSLDIKPGQKVGFVGHSGAGKSTIVNLLLRFMDVDGGHIRIDGQDIGKVTQQSLHESIAFVPQEPLLFHRSLRENIAYGKPDATEEQITMAASKAHALEFIEKLPNRFETLVGERGVKLSGGQRQRIAIARAILKDAPILVLDEATSALDSESELLIQDALSKLMKGRTSIVIAHRLSTIAKLDRIIVLESGKIIESGTHTELLSRGGTYAKLWSHQSGGFIED